MQNRLLNYYIFVLMVVGIGCSEWDKELPPVELKHEVTLEEYLHFKPDIYDKLCHDKEFIYICNLYRQGKNQFSTSQESFDSFIDLARNYGQSLDYCQDTCFMLYVFKYDQDHFSVPKTKYDLDEVVVEGDYDYLLSTYSLAYCDVMDLEQYVIGEIYPWHATEQDLYLTIISYFPQSEIELYV